MPVLKQSVNSTTYKNDGLLYNGYRVSFPGVKRPGRGDNHPPHLAPRLKKGENCTIMACSSADFAFVRTTTHRIVSLIFVHQLPQACHQVLIATLSVRNFKIEYLTWACVCVSPTSSFAWHKPGSVWGYRNVCGCMESHRSESQTFCTWIVASSGLCVCSRPSPHMFFP